MKYFLPVLVLFQLIVTSSPTQVITLQPEFGKFSKEEIIYRKCEFEPQADAVVLLDKAWSYNLGFFDYTLRRIRIKILAKSAIGLGDITLSSNSISDREIIDSVRALTANPDGDSVKIIPVERNSFYYQQSGSVTFIKFAMPEIKPGSIIEYEYRTRMRSFFHLPDWYFQSSIPTLKSCYTLSPPIGLEISYSIYKNPGYDVITKFIRDTGSYFEMTNIPSFKPEIYMDAAQDYLQRINFQVSRYAVVNVMSTWEDVVKSFLKDLELKKQMSKNLHHKRELKDFLSYKTDPTDKLRTVYNYVKENMKWNGIDGILPFNNLGDAWEERKGNTAEINFVLINLLKDADIEAYPLLVSERSHGKVDTTYPFLDQFNKVVALAIAGNKQYILDASEHDGDIDLTPKDLLNTYAFLLDLKKYQFVEIASTNRSYKSRITVDGAIDNDGNFKGLLNIKSYEYAKQYRNSRIKTDKEDYKKRLFSTESGNFETDSFMVSNMNADSLPMEMTATIRKKYEKITGYYLFNYNLFTNLEKNPFTADKRESTVNFGYPEHTVSEITLKLPENCKIDNIPENISISYKDDVTKLTRTFSLQDQVAKIRIEFFRNVSLVNKEDYKELKDFYKEIDNILNEPLVLITK